MTTKMKIAGDSTVSAVATHSAELAPQSLLRATLSMLAGTAMTLLALPVFWLFKLPLSAWLIGAGAVLANSLLHSLIKFLVRNASVAATLGAMGFSMIIRAGATALVFFFIGASVTGAPGDQPVGLDRPDLARIGIVVFLLGFTVDMFVDTLRRAAKHNEVKSSATTTMETSV